MAKKARDLYIPAGEWRTIVDLSAPNPRGTHPAFVRALEPFKRYQSTVTGDIGEIIHRCHKHLDKFLHDTQSIVEEEAGENPSRLGRLRDFSYGADKLQFQVFNYKGVDCVTVRSDSLATLLSDYERFHQTLNFLKEKVEQGNLGILKNSIMFIYKPLAQAADPFDNALKKLPIDHTTKIGSKPDPTYMEIVGTEPSDEIESGSICRVIKEGYAWEGVEIQEGVVMVAGNS